jgi:hypothetical protein
VTYPENLLQWRPLPFPLLPGDASPARGENRGNAGEKGSKPGKGEKDYAPDELIVRFRPTAVADDKARVQVTARAHGAVGATVKKDYSRRGMAGTQVVKLPPGKSVEEAIAEYQENPDVLSVTPNYKISLLGTPDDPLYSQEWGVGKIAAPWHGTRRPGQTASFIAVPDTGIDYSHPTSRQHLVEPREIRETRR